MLVQNLKELERVVKEEKISKNFIGTINGTFDLLHEGHIDAINYATKHSQKLFILINSDRSVKIYKGPHRPIEEQHVRANKMEERFPEHYIFIFDDINPLTTLEKISPNVHFIGPDWGSNTLEQKLIESHGGVVKNITKNIEISTTLLLRKDHLEIAPEKAIFLDRDGTIIVDKKYPVDPNQIEFLPKALKSLKKISKLGFKLFIVSNQSAVGRGITTQDVAISLNNKVVEQLKESGIEITKSFIDFSHPSENSKTRKPNTLFLENASLEYKLSLKDSWVIGDKPSDILFGKRGNTKTLQIKGDYDISEFADFYINNLAQAYEIISQH